MADQQTFFKVGTRNSELALAQTQIVLNQMVEKNPGFNFEVVPILTTGDFRRDSLKLNVEDKKQWVIEIEKRLLSREIDFAIHSAKDVPLDIEPGTKILTILERKDPRDILILKQEIKTFAELEVGSTIGTSSKRRSAQLKRIRPDINIVPFRGNINTRVQKLEEDPNLTGIVLAVAGLERLNIKKSYSYIFSFAEMLPPVGQGQLLAQYLIDHKEVEECLKSVNHELSQICYDAERSLVEILGADCHSCFGVNCAIDNSRITLDAIVLSSNGTDVLREAYTEEIVYSKGLAEKLGTSLIEKGAKSILQAG